MPQPLPLANRQFLGRVTDADLVLDADEAAEAVHRREHARATLRSRG